MCSCYVCLAHPILNKQRSIAYTTSAPPPAAPCERLSLSSLVFLCSFVFLVCFNHLFMSYLWYLWVYFCFFSYFSMDVGVPVYLIVVFTSCLCPPTSPMLHFFFICISRLSVFVVLYMHFPSVLCSPLVFFVSVLLDPILTVSHGISVTSNFI